jgi:uncharacterized protein (TIGR03503 family)
MSVGLSRSQSFSVFLRAVLGLLILVSATFAAANAKAGTAKADVRVLIDISGSMKENDPQNLRKPALELLVKLFPDSAKAGVWNFAENTRLIVPHRKVDEKWRNTGLDGAKHISSTGQFTNIPLALQDATKDITKASDDTDYHVILLTDGMVDVSKDAEKNEAATKKLHDDILPALKKRGVKVHTIALSANADELLMEKIAIATGGLSATAETAEELAKIFVQALDVAAPRQQVPLKNNRFSVDEHIKEFTLLVFRENKDEKTALLAADGKRYDADSKSADVNWFRNEGYDLVTVKKPVTGEWSIEAKLQPGSRVTIVSNMNLQASRFPSSFFVGANDELTATLLEDDRPILQQEFLKLIDMKATVNRRSDNQFWEQPLAFDPAALDSTDRADAPFSTTMQMLNQIGTYDIVVKADGKTFQRELRQTVSVYSAFEVVVVAGKEIPPVHTITLISRNPDVVPADSRVITHVTHPDGSETEPVAALQPNQTWQVQLTDKKNSGEFRIWFEIEAKDRKGNTLKYKTDPRTIIHLVPGEVSKVVEEKTEPAAPVQEEKVAPKPEVSEQPKEDEWPLSRILAYIGIALGNIIVLGLGFYAYRLLTAASKKTVLDQPDEDDAEIAIAQNDIEESDSVPSNSIDHLFPDEATQDTSFSKNEDLLPGLDDDDFALPDDAIDIDPDADDKK